MDNLIAFFQTVAAEVVAYYLCKWLDSLMCKGSKPKEAPRYSQYRGASLLVSQWNHAILTDALPIFSICNPAQKSSRQIKINNLPLECPAKTPADRGKSVNGGRGDVIFRWELPQSEPDGSASSLHEGA